MVMAQLDFRGSVAMKIHDHNFAKSALRLKKSATSARRWSDGLEKPTRLDGDIFYSI